MRASERRRSLPLIRPMPEPEEDFLGQVVSDDLVPQDALHVTAYDGAVAIEQDGKGLLFAPDHTRYQLFVSWLHSGLHREDTAHGGAVHRDRGQSGLGLQHECLGPSRGIGGSGASSAPAHSRQGAIASVIWANGTAVTSSANR